jgi:DNA/RNA non-specific endonuclease
VPLASFTYLFDATAPPAFIDNRVLAVVGRSAPPLGPRDRSRMASHPSPQRGSPQAVDRGHLVALSMGGGYDINLVPQLAEVNRRGRWREIERYCASHPGTFFFVQCDYIDASDHPSQLRYGWLVDDEFHEETFLNRRAQ